MGRWARAPLAAAVAAEAAKAQDCGDFRHRGIRGLGGSARGGVKIRDVEYRGLARSGF